jgi:SAM-dependent methyltransferase
MTSLTTTSPGEAPTREQPRRRLSRAELKRFVLERGCYDDAENLRIYEKWFSSSPRYLFRAVDSKYGLTTRTLCDLGCSYGMNLVHCTEDSYGVELEPRQVDFAKSLGLRVHQLDFVDDDVSALPKVDAVWTCAVMEHVDAPHVFLRKIHQILKPGGLVAVYVPTVPAIRSLRHLPWLGRYFMGHTASDHINFYTPATLRLECEAAGFWTVEQTPLFPGLLRLFNHVPPFSSLIDGSMYIGRRIDDWDYPSGAFRRAANNARGFDRVPM